MFSQGGLSLEQAPPISVVMKFFITASIFGLILGLYLLANSSGLLPLNNYTYNITVTHFLALGVMASFMFGALFQMLPVIAGVVIKMPTKKSMVAHILLVLGVTLQLLAFNSSISLLYLFSAIILGSGLLHATTLMIKELIKVQDHSSSSKGMILSLSSFTIAILFGIYLLLTLGGYIEGNSFSKIKEAHYSFALFGWVTLLIVSVSFQVVEMFYVTPKYPTIMSKYLVTSIAMLLLLKLIALFTALPTIGIDLFLALLFIVYGVITIHRLYKRKRPTSDATVWFWRLGIGLLIVSMSITVLGTVTTLDQELKSISYLAFIGFALSIVFAMNYKIVPFLTWFHLSNQGYIEAPMMHDVIHPKKAKIHFYVHVAMLLTWTISILFNPPMVDVLASILVVVSFGWLLYHLVGAVKKYNYTQKHTEKMEW
jgi:hypothetical protein